MQRNNVLPNRPVQTESPRESRRQISLSQAEEERERLIEDAPETYYLTDYYRRYPLVLARLSRIAPDALRDLLSVSWRLTPMKVRKRGRSQHHLESAPTSPYNTGRPR
jgi:hypothetical protein